MVEFGDVVAAALGIGELLNQFGFVVTAIFPQAVVMYNFRFAARCELNAIHHIVDCFCDCVWPFPGSHQFGWFPLGVV